MVYESLSSVLLVLIAAILMLGWLPGRTRRGMRRASQHRQDQMSASLHLLDESETGRFGDAERQRVKGLVMQPQQDGSRAKQEEARIKRVRLLRRAAIRRRRMLVAALGIATVCVAVMSYVLAYSLWYCIVPMSLLLLVLVSGARASAKARQWEQRVAQRRQKEQRAVPSVKKSVRIHRDDKHEQTTTSLSQEDIRAAIMLAQQLQQRPVSNDSAPPVVQAESSLKVGVGEESDTVSSLRDDALQKANSSHVNQQLLSFSMGEHRQPKQHPHDEVVSREIKSTRQVAKAIPPVAVQEPVVTGNKDKSLYLDNVRPADFHQKEVLAEVDVPEASDDSLGSVGVEAILARRSQAEA